METETEMTLYPEGKEPIHLRVSGGEFRLDAPQGDVDMAAISWGVPLYCEGKIETQHPIDRNWITLFERRKRKHQPQLARHLRRLP